MILLRVKDLSKVYERRDVVDRLSFSLRENECVALLGPNGAGKTTTLKMLSGLIKPTRGTIEFAGLNEAADLRAHIGYLPQIPVFYYWMTGKEFLRYVGRLAQMNRSDAIKRTDELLELVGLADAENRRISHYSGGMKQRLGIAQALIHRPKLVMLDEPVSALDPLGRRDVLNLLGQLKRETTVLFSTHVLHDAEAVSDSVLIMHEGQLKLSGRLQEIRQKHQRGTVVIEADEELAPLAKEWQRQGVISHFSQEGLAYKLVVDDLAQARVSLLQSLAAHRVSLSRFETGNTSLEQLFMEVVQS